MTKVATSARSKEAISSSISNASPATATKYRPSSPRSMERSISRNFCSSGPWHVADARAAASDGCVAAFEMRQTAVPQRARGARFRLGRIKPGDLPIPAGERQVEQRLAERLREFVVGILGRGEIGDQRAQIAVEAMIEGALDRLAVERGQYQPGHQEDHDDPAGRQQKQPQRKRISAHVVGA